MGAELQLSRKAVSFASVTRYAAIASALVASALYVLIGFQVVSIGEAASGGTPDLLGFGLAAGAFFAAIAVLMVLAQGRLVWVPIALADLAVIVAYFAMAGQRVPAFEVWGLLVKSAQVVMLGALGYLVYHGKITEGRR